MIVGHCVDDVDLRVIRLGLLLTLLLMTINLNNSATEKIPPSGKICPLVQWILISIVFILFALFEYFIILVVMRFWDKVTNSVNNTIHKLCFSDGWQGKIWEGEGQQGAENGEQLIFLAVQNSSIGDLVTH